MTPVVHVGVVLNAETSMQLVCQSLGRWGRFMLTGIAGLPNQDLNEKWSLPHHPSTSGQRQDRVQLPDRRDYNNIESRRYLLATSMFTHASESSS